MGVHGGLIKAFVTTLPFTMLGVLGAYNQVAQDSFDTPEFGPIIEERISAYVEPVSLTHRKLMGQDGDPSGALVREVANVWLVRYKRGELNQLPPVAAGDSTREGAKQQILCAKSCVITHLIRIGDKELNSGHPGQAHKDFTLALQLTKIMMFSDLTSLGSGLSHENGLIRRLTKLSRFGAVDLVPTTDLDVSRALRAEFRVTVADPRLSALQRKRMLDQYERAISHRESIRTILDGQLNDYSLSILFGNVRRVEVLVARQRKLIDELKGKAPGLVAQGNRASKGRSI